MSRRTRARCHEASVQSGYHVIPQWKVARGASIWSWEGNGRRYGHRVMSETLRRKLRDDLERQSMLERLGWTFSRVRAASSCATQIAQ